MAHKPLKASRHSWRELQEHRSPQTQSSVRDFDLQIRNLALKILERVALIRCARSFCASASSRFARSACGVFRRYSAFLPAETWQHLAWAFSSACTF